MEAIAEEMKLVCIGRLMEEEEVEVKEVPVMT